MADLYFLIHKCFLSQQFASAKECIKWNQYLVELFDSIINVIILDNHVKKTPTGSWRQIFPTFWKINSLYDEKKVKFWFTLLTI